MLEPIRTGRFKKEYALAEKRGKDMDKIDRVIWLLINEQPLPARYENHPLHGIHKGKWECHIEPDWLLEYRIDPAEHTVTFYRTGTHSDLF